MIIWFQQRQAEYKNSEFYLFKNIDTINTSNGVEFFFGFEPMNFTLLDAVYPSVTSVYMFCSNIHAYLYTRLFLLNKNVDATGVIDTIGHVKTLS